MKRFGLVAVVAAAALAGCTTAPGRTAQLGAPAFDIPVMTYVQDFGGYHIAGTMPPLEIARIAGIMAAKKTSDLIPLCHQINLSKVNVTAELIDDGIYLTAEAVTNAQTGVEMEALTGASVAALTVYDMCKAVDRGMSLEAVRLVRKSGGKSGTWDRPGEAAPASRRRRS